MANTTVVGESAAAHPPKKARTDDASLPSADKVLNAALAAATKANPPPPKEVRRVDYTPLPYKVTKVSLDFNIFERRTVVSSVLTVEKSDVTANDSKITSDDEEDGLVLNGEEGCVALLAVSVDGCDTLTQDVDYILKPGKLIIKAETLHRGASNLDGRIIVRTTVEIVPEDNTQLSGLYNDGTMFCTQCEAEGFRRITYYPDRCVNQIYLAYILLRMELMLRCDVSLTGQTTWRRSNEFGLRLMARNVQCCCLTAIWSKRVPATMEESMPSGMIRSQSRVTSLHLWPVILGRLKTLLLL